MLTDEQLFVLGRYQLGLSKVHEAVQRLNALAVDNGLDIRPIPEYPFGLSMGDSQALAAQHQRDLAEFREKAMERLAA